MIRNVIACGLMLGAVLAVPAASAREKLTGEQELAKLLEGRVAGKPVDCINMMDASGTTIIDKTAIVYQGLGTVWVNRTTSPDSLHSDDILVTKTWGSQLCRLDLVRLHDRTGGFFHGAAGLEQFVPYTRVPKPKVDAPKPAPQ